MTSPIRSVFVVSTGKVWIRPAHRHSRAPVWWWLFTSTRWTDALPINVYLIEHERGLVLFDSGQDRASVTDPDYFPRGFAGFIHHRLARFEIGADETLDALLEARGRSLSEVSLAILSHLHQDHIGGIPRFAELGIPVLVSEADWNRVHEKGAELEGMLPAHTLLSGLQVQTVAFDTPAAADLAPFEAAHDVFGDGSLVLLPTPGHSDGSMSLLVRRGDGLPPLILVADLSYGQDLFESERVPGVGDRRELLASTRAIKQLRTAHPGLRVLPAHDPEAAGLLD